MEEQTQAQVDTTPVPPTEPTVEEAQEPATQQVDWREEARDFIKRLPEGMAALVQANAALLPGSIEMAQTVLGVIVPNDLYEVNVIATSYGLGALVGLLTTDEQMLDRPQLTKDIALHHATAAFTILAENLDAEQTAQQAAQQNAMKVQEEETATA